VEEVSEEETRLRAKIAELEKEVAKLRGEIADLTRKLMAERRSAMNVPPASVYPRYPGDELKP
jgi:uncharacterized coiled-coil DUF342 family protein